MLALPEVLAPYPIPAYPKNPPPPITSGTRVVVYRSAFLGCQLRVDYSIDPAMSYQFGTLADAIIPEAVFIRGLDNELVDISQHLRDSVMDVIAGEVDSVLRNPETL